MFTFISSDSVTLYNTITSTTNSPHLTPPLTPPPSSPLSSPLTPHPSPLSSPLTPLLTHHPSPHPTLPPLPLSRLQHETHGLCSQDLQERKDRLLIDTADMLHIQLSAAEALLSCHGPLHI